MRKKILLVEDSKTSRDPVVDELQNLGLDVLVAADGYAGYQTALKNLDIKLIISDVNMPIMDGLAMLEKIRAIPDHASTLVIMLSAETDEALKLKGRQLGVKGWLRKPFRLDENLKAIIDKIKT